MTDKGSLTLRAAALTLLFTLFWLYAAGMAVPLAAVVPVALTAGILSVFAVAGRGYGVWRGIAGGVVGMVLAAVVCAMLDDHSFDGNIYHQEIIMALIDGWQPYAGGDAPAGMSIWALHYCKAIETAAAAVVAFTGRIESGKCVNFMLVGGAGLLVADMLRRLTPWPRKRLWAVVAVVVCNPVGVCQVLTYYVDFTKYYYILVLLVGAVWLYRGERKLPVALMMFAVWMAAGTKFNILFDMALWCGAITVWFLCHRSRSAAAITAAAALVGAIGGVLLTGWHPYVTNCISHGSPFYPLLGDGAVDIMDMNTPVRLAGNRVADFFISLFTVSLPTYGGRLGGFGALMPVCLVVSAIAMWRGTRSLPAVGWWIAALALLSCFVFPQSWWARYNCQLWLVVAMGAVAAGYCGRRLRRLTLGLDLVAVAISVAVAVGVSVRLTLRRAGIYRRAVTEHAVMYHATPQALRHFAEHGVLVSVAPDGAEAPRIDAVAFMADLDEEGVPVVEFSDSVYINDGTLREDRK